jgi:hypothetical protein
MSKNQPDKKLYNLLSTALESGSSYDMENLIEYYLSKTSDQMMIDLLQRLKPHLNIAYGKAKHQKSDARAKRYSS